MPPLAWVLLAINLFWVVAYDTEYAMVDRDDDVRIGIRTSALTFGRFDVAAVALCYAVYLAGMAWIGRVHALGAVYFAALAVALADRAPSRVDHPAARSGRAASARSSATTGSGMAVFAGIALDYAVRAGRWPRAW